MQRRKCTSGAIRRYALELRLQNIRVTYERIAEKIGCHYATVWQTAAAIHGLDDYIRILNDALRPKLIWSAPQYETPQKLTQYPALHWVQSRMSDRAAIQ